MADYVTDKNQQRATQQTDLWSELIAVTRNQNRPVSAPCESTTAYMEVKVLSEAGEDDFHTLHLNPERAMHFRIGDKLVIERERIEAPDFWNGTISDSSRFKIRQMKASYFTGSSDRSVILITERLFREDTIELHGKVIPEDI